MTESLDFLYPGLSNACATKPIRVGIARPPDHRLLNGDALAEEGAGQALEKALMITLDAYSQSGLVSDEEILQKLQQTFRRFKQKSGLRAFEGIEAYVLLNCDLGLEDAVVKELTAIPEVIEANGVFGVYDFVIKIQAGSEEEIKKAIARVRSIDKIKSSLTMMIIENQKSSRAES
jgi:hypothetical protein